jgi:fructose-1,6-bisphosphatase/inositol monophosphatase family enzyme
MEKGETHVKLLQKLATTLLIEITGLSLLATAFHVDFQSTAVLVIFNTLFVSLMFQLNGSFTLKVALLAAGNVLGAAWNYSFHVLILAAVDSLIVSEANLKILYSISYPFLNSLWVISFWSLSLTLLRYRPQVVPP